MAKVMIHGLTLEPFVLEFPGRIPMAGEHIHMDKSNWERYRISILKVKNVTHETLEGYEYSGISAHLSCEEFEEE